MSHLMMLFVSILRLSNKIKNKIETTASTIWSIPINTAKMASTEETLSELQKMVDYHREQMELAQAAIKRYEFNFVERVLALADGLSPATKKEWKRVVVKEDLVENVLYILEDCHGNLQDPKCVEDVAEIAKERMGELRSLKWKEFAFCVIQYLWKNGSFGNLEDGFDNFEDTAGGCDEITWNAALYLLENPDWKPKA